jgi:hypothetical protein
MLHICMYTPSSYEDLFIPGNERTLQYVLLSFHPGYRSKRQGSQPYNMTETETFN